MEKTGLPRTDLDPKPVKQAGDREAKFAGDDSIVDRAIAATTPKPPPRDPK